MGLALGVSVCVFMSWTFDVYTLTVWTAWISGFSVFRFCLE